MWQSGKFIYKWTKKSTEICEDGNENWVINLKRDILKVNGVY